jgi:hypothetical protein
METEPEGRASNRGCDITMMVVPDLRIPGYENPPPAR